MLNYFENIRIQRVASHFIPGGGVGEPDLSPDLDDFDSSPTAKSTLIKRITEVMSPDGDRVAMNIAKTSHGSAFELVSQAIRGNDKVFLSKTQDLSNKLHSASGHYHVKDSLLMVVQAKSGNQLKAFDLLILIKAESSDAFIKVFDEKTKRNRMTHLEQTFLTESQKMYKVACFVLPSTSEPEQVARYKVFLFDSLLNRSGISKAAQYFSDTFLGLDAPRDLAAKTQDFYVETLKYISSHDEIESMDKINAITGLQASLLNASSTILNPSEFATSFLPPKFKSRFLKLLEELEIGSGAFQKDSSKIENAIRKRRIVFEGNIALSAPTQQLLDSVSIEEANEEYTLIKVMSKIKKC